MKVHFVKFQRQSTNDFFDICLYLKPRYIIFENVAAFATNQGGANMQAALAGLVKSSYQVRFGVLRAGAHGVPQNRNRWADFLVKLFVLIGQLL